MAEVWATVGVSNISLTAIVQELFDIFDSTVGSIFACEVFSAHQNLKSKGTGRVQFETHADTEGALCRHVDGLLGLFLRAHLVLSTPFDNIIARSVGPRNHVRDTALWVGFLVGEGEMAVVEAWHDVDVEINAREGQGGLLMEQGGHSWPNQIVRIGSERTGSVDPDLGGAD